MEKNSNLAFVVCLLVFCFTAGNSFAESCNKRIGVSLHPYYSWVKNIVGNSMDVVPLITPGADPHTYQPLPADLANLQKLDAVVVNGLGHDEFVKPMLKAADIKDLVVLDTSKGLPLIPVFSYGSVAEENGKNRISYNSHTYISITGSIQQIRMIAEELGKLCPEQGGQFRKNSRAYAKRLRLMLAGALAKIDAIDLDSLRIATVHDGYAYLFQELGIEITAVVQPRHGIEPGPRQLQDTIKRIKRANVNILFTEIDYKKKYLDIIYQETGCRIYSLSHISNGEYTAERFENGMRDNLNDIIQALTMAGKAHDDTSK
ncbi:MAG: zinc ABC transporter substrate-binding protein [Thermodesulfobacteriota bacterium]|nr:zinc ABC transporter substrate-binding protein [Thermodesulfobacteriota bacterium]